MGHKQGILSYMLIEQSQDYIVLIFAHTYDLLKIILLYDNNNE